MGIDSDMIAAIEERIHAKQYRDDLLIPQYKDKTRKRNVGAEKKKLGSMFANAILKKDKTKIDEKEKTKTYEKDKQIQEKKAKREPS